MMGVSVLVPAMIRPGVTAAGAIGTGGAGSMMTVAAVATKAAVRLTLVQSAGGHLIARRVPGRVGGVVHRLAVFVVAEETIGRLRVRVRVLAAYLGVERCRDVGLTLQTVVIAAVLLLLLLLLRRRQVLVLVAAGRLDAAV